MPSKKKPVKKTITKKKQPKKAKSLDVQLLVAMGVALILTATLMGGGGLLKGSSQHQVLSAGQEKVSLHCPSGFVCSVQQQKSGAFAKHQVSCPAGKVVEEGEACGTAGYDGSCYRCVTKLSEKWQTCPQSETCTKVGADNSGECAADSFACAGGKKVCDGVCGRAGCSGRCCHCVGSQVYPLIHLGDAA